MHFDPYLSPPLPSSPPSASPTPPPVSTTIDYKTLAAQKDRVNDSLRLKNANLERALAEVRERRGMPCDGLGVGVGGMFGEEVGGVEEEEREETQRLEIGDGGVGGEVDGGDGVVGGKDGDGGDEGEEEEEEKGVAAIEAELEAWMGEGGDEGEGGGEEVSPEMEKTTAPLDGKPSASPSTSPPKQESDGEEVSPPSGTEAAPVDGKLNASSPPASPKRRILCDCTNFFEHHTPTSNFPNPPTMDCPETHCATSNSDRALKACPHTVLKMLRLLVEREKQNGGKDAVKAWMKKMRNWWHPDHVGTMAGKERRGEWEVMAKEVFCELCTVKVEIEEEEEEEQ
ncbi:unnamed protein product [Zymoseptoria tritici ST99CH_3D1]|nr:unnamed protein product [Zymoseptoria tritici ST99CH_3D1]